GSCLLYIDRHLLHEVTSPQAFEGLQLAGRQPWRLSANVATPESCSIGLGNSNLSSIIARVLHKSNLSFL
ncbi:hypothetical protein NQ759_18900, partial [Acinetobacter baumannii]|nr:hypothetical protein [Acinetobacter baumannii]